MLGFFGCLYDRLGIEIAFFRGEIVWDVIGGKPEGWGEGCGDMHGDLLHDFIGSFAGCLDEYACFSVGVDILPENPAFEFFNASDGDFLAS